VPPPVIIDTRPAQPAGSNVEQPTLIAAEPVTAADPTIAPRPTPNYDPPPGPTREPRPTPSYDPQPGPAREPRPTPSYDPQSGPIREPRPTPSYDPQPGPTYDPRPATTPPDVVYDPRPTPSREAPPLPAEDLSATNLIDLADRVATGLKVFKGDMRLALWLFEHAGGRAAAQTFIEQAHRAEHNPDNPIEQARLLDLAPTAARLLEAASMLANVVSSLGETTDDESETNAPDLQPVPRA
jgi:hypothetical protein